MQLIIRKNATQRASFLFRTEHTFNKNVIKDTITM